MLWSVKDHLDAAVSGRVGDKWGCGRNLLWYN